MTLVSLQNSHGNVRWVDRAKDESSNKLHMLVKPMLEQWAKLQDDPSCRPTKAKMKKPRHLALQTLCAVLRNKPNEATETGGK